MEEPSTARGVNTLKRKDPRGHTSLPAAPETTPGSVLAAALLADTLPGPTRAHPSRRVTASLAMRWCHPPGAVAPSIGRFERVSGLAPYIGVQGRIRDAHGRLVATSFAMFAQLPSGIAPRLARASSGAGPAGDPDSAAFVATPSVDAVAMEMSASVRAAAVRGTGSLPEVRSVVGVRPEWLNRIGILHGASGTALLVMAASIAVADDEATWPRVADMYVRFLEPVPAREATLAARVVRQSPRSADVEVSLEVAGRSALTARLLLLTPPTAPSRP